MKRRAISMTLIFTMIFLSTNVLGLRCGEGGRNVVTDGYHKYEVLNNCGSPVSKEIVGVDRNGRSSRIVEHWLYIIEEYGRGYMYLLKFNGDGILVEIEWLGERK